MSCVRAWGENGIGSPTIGTPARPHRCRDRFLSILLPFSGLVLAGEEVAGLRVAAAVPPSGEKHVRESEGAEAPEDKADDGCVVADGAGEGEPREDAEEEGGGGKGEAFKEEPASGAGGGFRKAGCAEVRDVADGMDEAKVEKKGCEGLEDREGGGGEEKFGHGWKPIWTAAQEAPEKGGGEAECPEHGGGRGEKGESGVERGLGGWGDQQGKEVAGGLWMKDEWGDSGEAASG